MSQEQLRALREQQRNGTPQIKQEQEEREQIKQAVIDTHVDVLSEIFETLWPSDVFRPILGINEYEGKRADFYRLNQAYFAEKIDELHQQSELALALKDERIKNLTDQANSLSETVEQITEQYGELKRDYDDVYQANNDYIKSTAENIEEIGKLHARVKDLEQKLEEAAKPKEVKTSQTMQDALNEVKSKSQMSVDDMIARFNARQKVEENKVQTTQVQPFRDEQHTEAESSGDQLSVAETPETVSQFQIEAPEVPAINPIPAELTVREMVSRTVEERLEALEKAVFGA